MTTASGDASIVESQLNGFPPIIAGQMLSDAATHEHDLRGARRSTSSVAT